MASYRIYRVRPGGRLQVGNAFEAQDDLSAVEQARTLHDASGPAELWAGGRLVGRLTKLGHFTCGGG